MKIQEQIKDTLYVSWNEIKNITQEKMVRSDGNFRTISVTNGGAYEVMIFLGFNDYNGEFEVTIHKSEPGIVFGPNAYDKFSHYELQDEFDIFFFAKFEDAKEFISILSNDYPEYQKRPYRLIEKSA